MTMAIVGAVVMVGGIVAAMVAGFIIVIMDK